MQTLLSPEFAGTPDGEAAQDIVRKCVHCGFCNATCPTYQLLGDELDGPRGRIYLIKQVLEGAAVTRSTQQHLDRCLTCLNCQTTCPSGVQYGQLVDIGRKIVDARVERPLGERTARWLLREGLTSPAFAPALRLGQSVRALLPAGLKSKVPARAAAAASAGDPGGTDHSRRADGPASAASPVPAPRRVLVLTGCVQPALNPNIDRATERVLGAAGLEAVFARGTGCCGAIRTHLGDPEGGRDDMRRNIDAWMPLIAAGGVEAIVSSASACSLAIKGYAHALQGDTVYAGQAARITGLARDLSELLPELAAVLAHRVRPAADGGRLAFHPPCTLQHGQRLGGVEAYLRALGFDVRVAGSESHLCCGSAGTYSVMQPELSRALRDRKLGFLARLEPHTIVSANVGCIQHLQSGTATPVKHWIEVLDEALDIGLE